MSKQGGKAKPLKAPKLKAKLKELKAKLKAKLKAQKGAIGVRAYKQLLSVPAVYIDIESSSESSGHIDNHSNDGMKVEKLEKKLHLLGEKAFINGIRTCMLKISLEAKDLEIKQLQKEQQKLVEKMDCMARKVQELEKKA